MRKFPLLLSLALPFVTLLRAEDLPLWSGKNITGIRPCFDV